MDIAVLIVAMAVALIVGLVVLGSVRTEGNLDHRRRRPTSFHTSGSSDSGSSGWAGFSDGGGGGYSDGGGGCDSGSSGGGCD